MFTDADETLEGLDAIEEQEPVETFRRGPGRPRLSDPRLRQVNERPAKAVTASSPSWWVGLSREAFKAESSRQQERMRVENVSVPNQNRILDFSASAK